MRSLLLLFLLMALLVTDTECGRVVCRKDYKTCPDGSKLYRDPKKRCRFPRCDCRRLPKGWTVASPSPRKCKRLRYKCKRYFVKWSHEDCGCGCRPRGCRKDFKTCPDGSKLYRDPRNRCRFPRCNCRRLPKGWTRVSPSQKKCEGFFYTCKRNFVKWSHEECGCGCRPRSCRRGTRTCPDGSKVERDPKDNCRFPKCKCPPEGWTLTAGPKKCKKEPPKCKRGYEPWSHARCGCGCKPGKCDDDYKTCPDGSKLYRDPKNRCRFPKCKCRHKGWRYFDGPATKCKGYRNKCSRGYAYWYHDDCGCGCRPGK